MSLILSLFWTFFIIGLFNFGGGGAMISLIQTQVVTQHQWVTESAFTDIIGISQSTPGPIGINCATYVGYEVAGVLGSAVATFAVVLPSFIIFFILVRVLDKFSSNPSFIKVMSALKPVIAGLIGAAALVLMFSFNGKPEIREETFSGPLSWIIFAAAFLATYIWKVSPILVILLSGIIGLLL